MKCLKKIVIVFLTIININLLTGLIISCNIQKVLINGVLKETIKTEISKTAYKEPNIIINENAKTTKDLVKTDNDTINKILESDEVQSLIEDYLNKTINSLEEPSKVNEIDFEKDIIDYLKNNKEKIEKSSGIEITDEMIDKTSKTLQENIQILSPIRKPIHDIICVGVNYSDHLKEIEGNKLMDKNNSKKPVYFSKRAIEIIGLGDKIKSRFDLDKYLDYEVELAIIIGKKGKDISVKKAKDYIFGYSIFNDISSRTIQKEHSQWYKGKSLDYYSAMGPCIVYKDDIKDIFNLEVKSILNEEVRQSSNTKYMIHDIYNLVSDISKGMTLEAGDIIATGTPGGVGMSFNPPKYMKSGDKIVCYIENIGELINFVE